MAATGSQLRPLLRPWVTALAQRSEATARNYEVSCRQFLDVVGDRELDPDVVGEYLESLGGLAPGSRATKISATRSFLRVAQSQGLVDRSPIDFLIRPRVSITSAGRYLQVEEVRRLVSAARELGATHFAVVLALWTTGVRASELAKAEWRDLYRDPDGRLGLRVVHGKGGKERVVKILDELFAALVTLHGSSDLGPSDRSPLIPGCKRSSWWVWRHVKDAVQKAELPESISCHWLRHSFATHSAHGGASVWQLMFALGHSRSETAARYVHQARGLEDSATDHLPALT